MSESTTTSIEPAVAAEPDIYCPQCDYNLRGLTEQRCPECGTEFDREALIKRLTMPDQPLPFGYPYSPQTSLWAIFTASLFSPARLGKLCPPMPSINAAIAYGIFIRGIGVFVFAILGSIAIFDSIFLFIGAILGSIPAVVSFIYEIVLSRLLLKYAVPINAPIDKRLIFWEALCHLFGAHCMCGLIIVAVFYSIPSLYDSGMSHIVFYGWYIDSAPVVIFGLMLIWWWYCLGRAIAVRSIPSAKRTIIIVLIPFISFCFCVILYLSLILFIALSCPRMP